MHEQTDGYTVPEQMPGMIESATEMSAGLSLVGRAPARGLRIERPLLHEVYTSRTEPNRAAEDRSRIIFWRPVGITTMPKGWIRSPLPVNLKRATAYSQIENANYAESWSKTAKRDLVHARERGISVEVVSYAEFQKHMPRRGKFRRLFSFMHWQARRFHEVYGDAMRWYLAKTREGVVAAGFAALYLPEEHFSLSAISFSRREVNERAAPVLLRDVWFRDALAQNITYLDWNILWRRGDPRSWRGFSQFKEKFKPHLVLLAPTYLTFVPSKQLSAWLQRVRRLLP